MGGANPEGYDPLASVSVMEQLRAATAGVTAPWKLPVIGAMPVAKQLQVLGTMFFAFVVLALLMIGLDNRAASQGAAATATATAMQMLSQRLARGSALASQGQAPAFASVKDSRARFAANLDALLNGAEVRGTSLDVPQDPTVVEQLGRIRDRWKKVDEAAGRLTDNEQSLTNVRRPPRRPPHRHETRGHALGPTNIDERADGAKDARRYPATRQRPAEPAVC